MNKLRVLIIEDEADIVEALKLRLEANGYETLVATDGKEGLDKARSEKPDLIIMDVRLPKMDGFKISRILKFDENYRRIPIVMLTAKVHPSDIQMGKEAGADAYITKPYKAEDLLAKIKELLTVTRNA